MDPRKSGQPWKILRKRETGRDRERQRETERERERERLHLSQGAKAFVAAAAAAFVVAVAATGEEECGEENIWTAFLPRKKSPRLFWPT